MEVKINKEIRNYTESMFFGLSLQQFVFSLLAVGVAVGLYFLLKPHVGTETVSWMLYSRRGSFCSAGLCQLPWHDRRAVFVGVDSLRAFGTETAIRPADQLLLRSIKGQHCRP